MVTLCPQRTKSNTNEREFCRALLNNNRNPIWIDNDMTSVRKRGCRLPPDDFVYGLKHPKQDGITGVAAALQHDDTPIDIPQPKLVPNFIAINKLAVRLGLTKVQDLHHYRRTTNHHQTNLNTCYHACTEKKSIANIIHGRATGEQQSIRDLIENKYLHEWLHKDAIRRCKAILNISPRKPPKLSLLQPKSNMKKNTNYVQYKQME